MPTGDTCKYGHPWAVDNIYIDDGKKRCRTCRIAHAKAYYKRNVQRVVSRLSALRHQRAAAGVCVRCGAERRPAKYKHCEACRRVARIRKREMEGLPKWMLDA